MLSDWSLSSNCNLCWPYNEKLWRKNAKPVQRDFVKVVNKISSLGTDVCVFARKCDKEHVRKQLNYNINVKELDYDDIWIRDTGPIYKQNRDGTLGGVTFKFNGWGNIHDTITQDQTVASQVMESLNLEHESCVNLVLEGGNVTTNGFGTAIITLECLLHSNPDLSLDTMENLIKFKLGLDRIIWIPKGLHADDDTKGHVDNMVRFIGPNSVVMAWTDDKNDPQFEISVLTLDILKREGLFVNLINIPPPMFVTEETYFEDAKVERPLGTRLPASYINFYMAREGLIIPTFGNITSDMEALHRFYMLFPNHRILGVDSREILLGGGSIHCITN